MNKLNEQESTMWYYFAIYTIDGCKIILNNQKISK